MSQVLMVLIISHLSGSVGLHGADRDRVFVLGILAVVEIHVVRDCSVQKLVHRLQHAV